MFMQLQIIKLTRNACAFVWVCTYVTEIIHPTITIGYLHSHMFHKCLCNSTYKDIFTPACLLEYVIQTSLSLAPENVLQKETATIYTPTYMYTLYGTVHFNIWQHFHTSLDWFKNKSHQVGSLYPLVKSKSNQLKTYPSLALHRLP